MGCYYDEDLETRRATVQDMIENFNSITADGADFVSTRKIARAWLAGFVMGWVTGLNNPDLANGTTPLSLPDCLTCKHTPLYRNLVLQTEEASTAQHPDTETLSLIVLQEV